MYCFSLRTDKILHSLWHTFLWQLWSGIGLLFCAIRENIHLLKRNGGFVKRVESGKSGIHIKPENRGKLTRLKKRTGKSEAELWKEGNPAVRKMITFARNARK